MSVVLGTIDFNGFGIAGCVTCGWRGVPTILDGRRQTDCPLCSIDHALERRAMMVAIEGGAKVGRNAPCPCGSGRKFKKCCAA